MSMRFSSTTLRVGGLATLALALVIIDLSSSVGMARQSQSVSQANDPNKKNKSTPPRGRTTRRRTSTSKAKDARIKANKKQKPPTAATRPPVDPALQRKIDEAARAAQQPRPTPAGGQPGLRSQRPPTGPRGTTPRRGTGGSTKLDIPPIDSDVPPEEKTYSFSCKDCTYAQLVEGFARQTGLGVIGEAPKDGKVNFVTTEQLSFQEAMSRIRMLLFNYKPLEPYWLKRYDTHLAVVRINDLYRALQPDQMFKTVDDFLTAHLPEDELALVIYTPKVGSVVDLSIVRDFMPDYVRVAPLDGKSVTIFALVKDINKYLDLVPIFVGRKGDPRTIEPIKLKYILPSQAITKLETLMGTDNQARTPRAPLRRRGKDVSPLDTLKAPGVILMPDDAQRVLLVRAMQDKIEEIKLLLPYLDIDTTMEGAAPVVIPLKHADPRALLETIQRILTVYSQKPQTPDTNPRTRTRRVKTKASATQFTSEGVMIFVHPSQPALVVLADEENLARIRKLVKQFDVPSQVGPLRLPLQAVSADKVIPTIRDVLESGKAKPVQGGMSLMPDPAGGAIWFRGSEEELKRVKELVTILDVAKPDATFRIVHLRRQKPSFVANVLREMGKGGSTRAAPVKTTNPRRPQPAVVTKFTANDEQMTLYLFCTDKEWEQYDVVIRQLEGAIEDQPPFVRLNVENITPNQAVEHLSTVFATDPQMAKIRYTPIDRALLVFGARPDALEQIKAVLAEVDQSVTMEQRTFIIRHGQASAIRSAIETLIGTEPTGQVKVRRSKPIGKGPHSAGTVLPTMTVLELDDRLIVRTSSDKMARVAALIAELDVEEGGSQLKVYDDFPPGSDIDSIADTLANVMSGAPMAGARSPKGRVRGTTPERPRFIPQPQMGKLLVLANPDQFARIEELLEVLRAAANVDPYVTGFIELQYSDPDEVVELITPLLRLKAEELVRAGVLRETPEKGKPRAKTIPKRSATTGATYEHFHIAADSRNGRIVVAAPDVLLQEARKLAAQFDQPDAQKVEFRTINLVNAEPGEMVRSLREMMGAAARRAGRKAPSKGAVKVKDIFDGSRLSVVEAPGGQAIILHGPAEAVDKAADWIQQLDSISTRGRSIKVYEIRYADVTKLGELIMNVVDSANSAKQAVRPRGPRRGSASAPEEEETFELNKVWTGQNLYIQADLVTNTMIVAAPENKIAAIDDIVAQFDKQEGEIGTVDLPKFVYELKNRDDAFDAAFDLETLLETVWDSPDEVPKVDSLPFGNMLVVRYPHENRFQEIKDLIHDYIDKPKPGERETKKKGFSTPTGISAMNTALWLKMNHPELDIEIVDVSTTADKTWGVQQLKPKEPVRVNPCVLPAALVRLAQQVVPVVAGASESAGTAQGDTPPRAEHKRPGAKEAAPPAGSSSDLLKAAALSLQAGKKAPPAASKAKATELQHRPSGEPISRDEKVKIYVDDATGAVTIEGQGGILEEIPDWLDDLEEEIKELPRPPDIRIYRVRYIDVFSAAEILEEMFNATRQQRQQAQQQQRLAQQQRARQAQQQQRLQQQQQQQLAKGQAGQGKKPGQRGQPQPQPAKPQLPTTTVRVFPNPRDRTLILRADTNQFPTILQLLATIDQPQPINSEFRVFTLHKLSAVAVEDLLKGMLDLGQERKSRSSGTGRTAGRRRGSQAGRSTSKISRLPQTIMQTMADGVGSLGVDPQDIKLSSNEETNTIIVMAPPAALKFIDKLIGQLESEEMPERITKYYQLKFADAENIADYLDTRFSGSGEAGKGKKSGHTIVGLNAPSFLPYPRLNLLAVLATAEQIEEVDGIVERLDVTGEKDQWEHVALTHADAGAVAGTLTKMFGSAAAAGQGSKRGAGGGQEPSFIGDDGGRVVLFSAPRSLHESILDTIDKLEADAADHAKLRVIKLAHAKPSDLAQALEEAYGTGGKGGRGTGKSKAALTLIPHDPTKQLFVRADERLFSEIESLSQSLDTPNTVGFEFRIYPLQYANAKQVHTQMTSLMNAYLRGLAPADRKKVDAFSIEVDEQANALIVLGGQTVFSFLEENLPKIDTPAAKASQTGFLMVRLKNADAQELAQTITRLWAQKKPSSGETPLQAEANRSSNTLIVRGSQADLDEIREQVIGPLEEQAKQALETESITLQYADPQVVAESITRIFKDKKEAYQGLRGNNASPLDFTVVVTPDVNTRQILVAASKENMALIKTRVAQLDREEVVESSAVTMKIYPIKQAEPADVVKIITEWARSRPKPGGRKAAEVDPVNAVAEPATRTVVVAASAANHRIIRELINGLDDKSLTAQAVGESLRVVPLLYGDAAEMESALKEYLRKPGGRGGRDGQLSGSVRISVLAQSNSLVISGSQEEVEHLETTVHQLDSAGEEGSLPQIIRLKHAKAAQIAPSLQDLFSNQKGRPRNQAQPVIIANEAANTLIVRAGTRDLSAIHSLVDQLDVEEEGVENYRLISIAPGINVTDLAGKVEQTINESAQAAVASDRGRKAATITVTPDTRTSSVIVAGSASRFDDAEKLIHAMEKMGPSGAKGIRIVKLGKVPFDEIQRLVDRLRGEPSSDKRSKKKSTSRSKSKRKRPRKRSSRRGR